MNLVEHANDILMCGNKCIEQLLLDNPNIANQRGVLSPRALAHYKSLKTATREGLEDYDFTLHNYMQHYVHGCAYRVLRESGFELNEINPTLISVKNHLLNVFEGREEFLSIPITSFEEPSAEVETATPLDLKLISAVGGQLISLSAIEEFSKQNIMDEITPEQEQ